MQLYLILCIIKMPPFILNYGKTISKHYQAFLLPYHFDQLKSHQQKLRGCDWKLLRGARDITPIITKSLKIYIYKN